LPETAAATPTDRWQRAVTWMLQGEKGTSLHLLVRVPGGDPRGLSVTRSLSLNDRWPLDPPAFAVDSLPGGVAVVRIGSLTDEDVVRQFDRTYPDFGTVQGLVLDLRGASGGQTEYAYQIVARLTDQPFSAVRWKTPQYRAAFHAWNLPDSAMTWYGPAVGSVAPRREHPAYGGPIALLASSVTSGAAEDLLAAFRATGRGVIIGEPSAGSVGDIATSPLPEKPHHVPPRAVGDLGPLARAQEPVADAGIDRVAVALAVGPDRGIHARQPRIDPRVVLGVDSQTPGANARHGKRFRAGPVAD